MENKVNKWFEAAKRAEPIISAKDVEVMISNPPAAKGRFFSFRKRIVMGTLFLIITGWLYWFTFSTPAELNKPNEVTTQTITNSLNEHPKQEQLVENLSSVDAGEDVEEIIMSTIIPQMEYEPGLHFTRNGIAENDQHDSLIFWNRILVLDEKELKELGISIVSGAYNYYYKTYAFQDNIKATQLKSQNDSFYFAKGYPGRNYFMKPWETDFYPVYLTDSNGNHQRNFHFQDRLNNQTLEVFNDSLRALFLASYHRLIPIGIRTPENGNLEIVWYKPTKAFINNLPKRYSILFDDNMNGNAMKKGQIALGHTGFLAQNETLNNYVEILLTNEELLKLGIRTDGNVLEYLNQYDTSAQIHFDFDTKTAMVFAMDLKISKTGGCRTNNIHALDSNLVKYSNNAVPLIITRLSDEDNLNESYSVLKKDIPSTKLSTFAKAMRSKLIPVKVKTKGQGVAYVHDNTVIFWYKNNQNFREKLPYSVAENLSLHEDFSEQELLDYINELNIQAKEEVNLYKPADQMVNRKQAEFVQFSNKELRKLHIKFNGKKLGYKVFSYDLDSHLVIIDLDVTPDIFQLNNNHRRKKVKLKQTEKFAWYITDSNLNIEANFIDPISQVGNQEADEQRLRDQGKLFLNRLDNLIPLLVIFSPTAMKKAKYGKPSSHLVFWFPATPEFLNNLPARVQEKLGFDQSNTHAK
jgi:hypothetical protein